MTGQARFTYTDADMVSTQRAGWTWYARWRHVVIAYLVVVAGNISFLAGLNAAYGTRSVPSDPTFVILGSVPETALLFGLMLLGARKHGRQVLRSRVAGAWSGRDLGGEHAWAWNRDGLHLDGERGRADLAWTSVGAWLDAPKVLLLYPSGGRAYSLPEPVLAAGWRTAPKLLIFPFGGYALALPKRAMPAGQAEGFAELLRAAGVRERRRFGLIAARGTGAG